jgi:2-dehydro-3-deoxyglucarate aldolase
MNPLFEKVSVGSWITLAHPAIAEIMASAGFDWLAVDLEHSVITIREAEELIRIINLKNVVPLVRLSSNNSIQIKRVMDAGAHGVIVPMVNSAEAAMAAVAAVKYPPVGERSFALARAHAYGVAFDEYLEWQKDNSMVVVQIEHIEAVKNLEAILSVSGVDAYFVGPYDLSGSIGIPGKFEHPEFIRAMETIQSIAKRSGKPGGMHIVEPDTPAVIESIKDGARFVAYSMDTRILDTVCRDAISQIRGLGK